MKTQKEKTEALEDIVFRDRNKDYGAYEIRRRYAGMLNRATAISIMTLLTVLAYPLIANYYHQQRVIKDNNMVTAEIMDIDAPPVELPPPPPPPAEPIEEKTRFRAPVVSTDTVPEGNLLNIDDLLAMASNAKPIDTEFGKDTVIVPDVIEHPEDNKEFFLIVEENPTYTGGDEARLRFLKENMVYPKMAIESQITGTVYITFIVDTRGKVSNVTLERGIGGGCDEEAMRVVKMMNGWNAGKQGGKAVNVKFTMPVKFSLQ